MTREEAIQIAHAYSHNLQDYELKACELHDSEDILLKADHEVWVARFELIQPHSVDEHGNEITIVSSRERMLLCIDATSGDVFIRDVFQRLHQGNFLSDK